MLITLLCAYFIIGAVVLEDAKKVVKKVLKVVNYLELALFMWKENLDTDEQKQLIDDHPKIATLFVEAGTILTWPMVLPRLIKTKRAYKKFLRRRREEDADIFKDVVFREYYEAMKKGEVNCADIRERSEATKKGEDNYAGDEEM